MSILLRFPSVHFVFFSIILINVPCIFSRTYKITDVQNWFSDLSQRSILLSLLAMDINSRHSANPDNSVSPIERTSIFLNNFVVQMSTLYKGSKIETNIKKHSDKIKEFFNSASSETDRLNKVKRCYEEHIIKTVEIEKHLEDFYKFMMVPELRKNFKLGEIVRNGLWTMMNVYQEKCPFAMLQDELAFYFDPLQEGNPTNYNDLMKYSWQFFFHIKSFQETFEKTKVRVEKDLKANKDISSKYFNTIRKKMNEWLKKFNQSFLFFLFDLDQLMKHTWDYVNPEKGYKNENPYSETMASNKDTLNSLYYSEFYPTNNPWSKVLNEIVKPNGEISQTFEMEKGKKKKKFDGKMTMELAFYFVLFEPLAAKQKLRLHRKGLMFGEKPAPEEKEDQSQESPMVPKAPLTPTVPKAPLTPPVPKAPLTPPVPKAPLTPPVPKAPLTPPVPKASVTPPVPKAPLTQPVQKAPLTPLDPIAPLTPLDSRAPLTPTDPKAPSTPPDPKAPSTPPKSPPNKNGKSDVATGQRSNIKPGKPTGNTIKKPSNNGKNPETPSKINKPGVSESKNPLPVLGQNQKHPSKDQEDIAVDEVPPEETTPEETTPGEESESGKGKTWPSKNWMLSIGLVVLTLSVVFASTSGYGFSWLKEKFAGNEKKFDSGSKVVKQETGSSLPIYIVVIICLLSGVVVYFYYVKKKDEETQKLENEKNENLTSKINGALSSRFDDVSSKVGDLILDIETSSSKTGEISSRAENLSSKIDDSFSKFKSTFSRTGELPIKNQNLSSNIENLPLNNRNKSKVQQ